MALKSVAELSGRLDKVAQSLSTADMKKRLTVVGVAAKADAAKAARADLGGDGAFSGWKPLMPLQAKFQFHQDGKGITVSREPRSAGPWRVAEQGRNQGNASGFSGPGLNTKTGVTSRTKSGALRTRARKGRRWNGTTQGKNTWSDAAAVMAKEAPKTLDKLNRKAVVDAFKGVG